MLGGIMKRVISIAVLVTVVILIGIVLWTKQASVVDIKEDVPNSLPPSIMVKEKLYYYTGEKIHIDINEEEYAGRTIEKVPLSQWPDKEGVSNFLAISTPYAYYNEQLIALIDQEWFLFESRD